MERAVAYSVNEACACVRVVSSLQLDCVCPKSFSSLLLDKTKAGTTHQIIVMNAKRLCEHLNGISTEKHIPVVKFGQIGFWFLSIANQVRRTHQMRWWQRDSQTQIEI